MGIAPRSRSLRQLTRLFRIAREADATGLSSKEALEKTRETERAAFSRRQFLGGTAAAAALFATRKAWAVPKQNLDVGIVGAGLAGLQCAYTLSVAGTAAQLYEASNRVGGRQFSLRDLVPGQVGENGGELIDTPHKTMQGWIQTLKLTREDLTKPPGDIFYFFDGQLIDEATIMDEYRALVPAMNDDIRLSTGAPTADSNNAVDRTLDGMNLADYLTSRHCGHWARKAIEQAYISEYGREITEQSCLNFVLFTVTNRRSKFTPFGNFSDERYHVVEGNDRISNGIAALLPKQPQLGMRLEAVRKLSSGRIELTFRQGTKSVTRTHDRVVLAIPFSVLRTVSLDASLDLPAWKTLAINTLGYGDNAKMMIGYKGPVWVEMGCNGSTYSDLPNHQATWESAPSTATTAHAIMTDYSGGVRGKNLDPSKVQTEAAKFVTDLDKVLPGTKAAAMKSGSNYVVHMEHWPSNPLTRGSYTCYLPNQFTTIADNEKKPIGNLYFAGEHTNSFYEWQGYQEGALLSGITAANQILKG